MIICDVSRCSNVKESEYSKVPIVTKSDCNHGVFEEPEGTSECSRALGLVSYVPPTALCLPPLTPTWLCVPTVVFPPHYTMSS